MDDHPWLAGAQRPTVSYQFGGSGPQHRTRPVAVEASGDELDHLVERGYLVRPGLADAVTVAALGSALDRLSAQELGEGGGRPIAENGYYVRDVLAKDEVFLDLAERPELLTVARAMLGPQVRVIADARVAFSDTAGLGLDWHIHMPVVPEPIPPWFCHPHQLHILVYLDDVGPAEGALQLLPGSHLAPRSRPPGDEDRGVVDLHPRAGDAVLIHGNLWHRTRRSLADTRRRRLLLYGYANPWLLTERRPVPGQVSVGPERPLVASFVAAGDQERRELFGGFRW